MGRKNRRGDKYEPLDLTPLEKDPPLPRRLGDPLPRYSQEQMDERRRRQEDSQRLARMSRGIDWSVCIVPGCGRGQMFWRRSARRPDRRKPNLEIPICYEHAAIVWKELVAGHSDRGEFIQAIADVNAGVAERQDREHEARKAANLANIEQGEIYFVKLGGLVKVGWTRDLWSRLKSYGASAELLLCYPASRDDETNLHRQLRPALAKGREWYEDGPIINHYLDEALAKYGQPRTFDGLWTKPKRIVAGKRINRSA